MGNLSLTPHATVKKKLCKSGKAVSRNSKQFGWQAFLAAPGNGMSFPPHSHCEYNPVVLTAQCLAHEFRNRCQPSVTSTED